jgi:toxoflavin synthase
MANSNDQNPQYDAIATSYDRLWLVPAVAPLLPLLRSTIDSLGTVPDASVLDLATGTGIGLRIARAAGASRLVGVDISPRMLAIARITTPGGILHTADCSKPLDGLGLEPGSFDIVLGIWLLNQCHSVAELAGMWGNIARYLKPGGSFVGVIENHDIVHPVSVRSFKYGAMESKVTEFENGKGWSVHVAFETKPKIEIDGFRYRKDIFETEARNAGMGEITYHSPQMEHVKETIREGTEEEDTAWWDEFLNEPPNFVVVSRKE